MRYNNIERIGVNKTESIIIGDLGWIFREQSIVDIGVDAIIEQVENDVPTGKFLAVQIKTGLGNFYKTEKNLVLYVSHIHYNYWLNLNIPIIVVAHLPEEDITIWQEINERNFKKSKKKWKLEIPYNQSLSKKSEERLNKILVSKPLKEFNIEFNNDNDYDNMESISCIEEASTSIFNISDILNDFSKTTNILTARVVDFNNKGLIESDDQVISSFKLYAQKLSLVSRRLENEINIFSELYVQGVQAVQHLIKRMHEFNLKFKTFNFDPHPIYTLPQKIQCTIESMEGLKSSVLALSMDYKFIKEAKVQHAEVINLIIFELSEAIKMTESLIEAIKKIE